MDTLRVYGKWILPFKTMGDPSELRNELISSGINEEELKGCFFALSARYRGLHDAFQMVKKRYIFYQQLLTNSASHQPSVQLMDGKAYAQISACIENAMENCLAQGEKLFHKIVIERKELPKTIRDYLLWKKKMNLSHSVLLGTRFASWNFFSDCERHGVCVCEKGNKEPYMRGCVSDPTLLRLISEEDELRMNAKALIESFFPGTLAST